MKQKTALMQRFIRNALPANVSYQYSQLRDNCATRPRDHLDAVLHGKISDAFHNRPAAATYRQYMTFNSSPVWWVNMGLDILTNDVLDRPISNWEEMFLPRRLQQLLALLPAYDDDGREVAGQTLLTDPLYLIDLPDPLPGPNPYSLWLLLAGGPLSLLLLTVWQRPLAARSARWLGASCLMFGFWSAFWATLYSSNWIFSRYIEAKHNSLLWLFWPIDWIFVYYGIRLMRKRSLPGQDSRLGRLVRGLSLLHVAALICAALLWMAQVIHQDILPELASFGAFGALFYVTISCHGAAKGSRPSDA